MVSFSTCLDNICPVLLQLYSRNKRKGKSVMSSCYIVCNCTYFWATQYSTTLHYSIVHFTSCTNGCPTLTFKRLKTFKHILAHADEVIFLLLTYLRACPPPPSGTNSGCWVLGLVSNCKCNTIMVCMKYFCIGPNQNGSIKRVWSSTQNNGCQIYDF